MEWELQQIGFDYTYDKRLYDRLLSQNAQAIVGHLCADPVFMKRSIRFLENHDEARAATAFPKTHYCAAVITFTVPGMHFFHEGQFEGYKSKISMHVGRRYIEPVNAEISEFYSKLIKVVSRDVIKNGSMQSCRILPAWDGNGTCNNFIAYTMSTKGIAKTSAPLFIVVNFGQSEGQCYIKFGNSFAENFHQKEFLSFRDLMHSGIEYYRPLSELVQKGMYFDMLPLSYHVLEVN